MPAITRAVESLGDVRALAAAIACIAIYAVTMGLAYPLLSLILESRGVDRTTIGLIAAAPSLAMLVAPPWMPRLAHRLGMRSFLVLCIAADLVCFLLLPVFDGVVSWFVLRLLAGAALAGLFVAGETWINQAARDATRGQVIGVYTTVVAGGMAVGPLVIPLVGIEGWAPFLVGAAFIALSALPLLGAGSAGHLETAPRSGWRVLSFVVVAPTIALAVLLAAFKDAAGYALLPVFGVRSGLSVDQAAIALTVTAVGAVALQVPIGVLADRWSRYRVLLLCGAGGTLGALLLPLVVGAPAALWPLLFLWGGLFSGVYTVAIVILGQRFSGAELMAANAAVALLWGVGSLLGPALAGAAMDRWDPDGFAATVAGAGALFLAVAALRRWRARPE